jgi:glucokinase
MLPPNHKIVAPVSGDRTSSPPAEVIGIDIGGTKCVVSLLRGENVVEVARMPTRDFEATFGEMVDAVRSHCATEAPLFGISCGGPLDAAKGIIVCPPNLAPTWHGVPIVRRLTDAFGGSGVLMNDANACALAEWRFGAGRGTQHMIFLTAGTGMGAGLILNGRLFEGATGDAGEIGHVRLAPDGPEGYGKRGSVEGFCSGGGISRLAFRMLEPLGGRRPAWSVEPEPLTTKRIADAAKAGDAFASAIMNEAGARLGEALAILVDLFNPECIVLGGFFPLCRELLEPAMRATLAREALPGPLAGCAIYSSTLGTQVGSYGAIAAALHGNSRA